jgi:hypothetical protein
MNDILNDILNAGTICIVLILIGIWFERWLTKNGFVRDNTISVIALVIISVAVKQLWYSSISWWYFVPFIILAIIFGVNRGDLWTTMNKGKWWWK